MGALRWTFYESSLLFSKLNVYECVPAGLKICREPQAGLCRNLKFRPARPMRDA